MKYSVNWVEKNLGLSRKVLRIYEEKGLMDKSTFQNPENKYREYSDKDIEQIWCYRMLQGVGYTLNDIVEMTQNVDFDFQVSLSERINDHRAPPKSRLRIFVSGKMLQYFSTCCRILLYSCSVIIL